MNKIKSILRSKAFRIIVIIVGVFAVLSLVFQMGVMAGFRRASFGRDWGDNYSMNFGMPRMGPRMMDMDFGNFGKLPNAHGAIGKIVKLELPSIVVLDEKDNTEKPVLVNEKTEIRKVRTSINSSDLKIDDHVVIMGAPNSSGQIEARLIRILPVPLPLPINK
jgi:hypothetical protein